MHRITISEADRMFSGNENGLKFLQSLFDSFSLLSWVSNSHKIEIMRQDIVLIDEYKQIKIFSFKTDKFKENFLLEINKSVNQKKIEYGYVESKSLLQEIKKGKVKPEVKIQVIISHHLEQSTVNKGQTQRVIYIDITDKDQYFGKIVKIDVQRHRFMDKLQAKQHEIEYYYKEPQNVRNKNFDKCHFNLAFQGGGAKGISYIGVYKALKQLHRNVPISSIIGSSAGSILGIAISTQMNPQDISNLCLKMDTIPKDQYFKNQSEITKQDQDYFDELLRKIKCLLHNYGILENSLFDQIADNISNIETSEKILNVLRLINPSIADLFSLELKDKHTTTKGILFSDKIQHTARFNYYGLLKAGLMKGQAVENIVADCLINFISKNLQKLEKKTLEGDHQKRKAEKIKSLVKKWGFNPSLDQNLREELFESEEFLKKVKTLTMKEYYEINQIEFTTTSVDLNDKILRFFNHKTTPNLPVCKSVQMSGSFPIAFQAQKWQRQWGKYYIHYKETRKQIDLTGHTFTDGGLLANLPIKYIDNELMRPIYFSHQKNGKTILYGFGVDQSDSSEKQNKSKAIELQEAVADLKKHISSKISKLSLIKNFLLSNSSSKEEEVKFEEVPVLDFVLKLIDTLSVSDYNLNIECFQKTIVQTEITSGHLAPRAKNVNTEILKIQILIKTLSGLENSIQQNSNKNYLQKVSYSCNILKSRLNNFETVNFKQIQIIKEMLAEQLYHYQTIRIKSSLPQCLFVNQVIKNLQEISCVSIFKKISCSDSKQTLNGLIEKIQNHFSLKQFNSEFQSIFSKMVSTQLDLIHQISNKMNYIIQSLKIIKSDVIECEDLARITFLDKKTIEQIFTLEKRVFLKQQSQIDTFIRVLQNNDSFLFHVQKTIQQNHKQLKEQLEFMIDSSQSNKIHLVLEAKQSSHLYYEGIFGILQQVMSSYQAKQIKMITCSDVHSVFAFLFVSGKNINSIHREMGMVKNFIKFEDQIISNFNSYKWSRIIGEELRDLLEQSWREQYQAFEELQNYIIRYNRTDVMTELEQVRSEFLYSKRQVSNAFEKVLTHVIKQISDIKQIKDQREKLKMMARKLSLKFVKDYHKENKKLSKNFEKIMKILLYHFSELVIFTILNCDMVKDTFENISPDDQEILWKGILIKKLLTAKKLEIYIKTSLQSMKLNRNTTLSEYYNFCPKKITLNFPLINKDLERVEMINRFTNPNMPIWAAIMASTSIPFLLPEFASPYEWTNSPFMDSRVRQMMNYFLNSGEKRTETKYISGNFIMTLPLELLTNNKMIEQNFVDKKEKELKILKNTIISQYNEKSKQIIKEFEEEEEDNSETTLITFSFKKAAIFKPKSYEFNSKGKQFFSFTNVLNLGFEYLKGTFKNASVGMKSIMQKAEIAKLLSLRIQCHDNTITNLYYDQTIKLPIKLGTLDFYKLQNTKESLLYQSIYQAEFVVRGIFNNLKVDPSLQKFEYLSQKKSFLEIKVQGEQFYLKFPSVSKWNKKLSTKKKIYFKLYQDCPYKLHEQQYIPVPLQNQLIFLKFSYPGSNMLLEENQFEFNLKHLKKISKSYIFQFNYDQIGQKHIQGSELNPQELKTRVFNRCKTYVTKLKIMGTEKSYSSRKNAEIRYQQEEQSKSEHQNSINQFVSTKTQEIYDKNLIIKSVVSLKNHGIICKSCIKPLSKSNKSEDQLVIGSCMKCMNSKSMIAYECQNKICKKKSQNKYCFKCLQFYLIERKDKKLLCKRQNHTFKEFNPQNTDEVAMCQFCGKARFSYFIDSHCHLRICQDCSMFIESREGC